MAYTDVLEIAAHWAAIVTACIAGIAGLRFWMERRAKRRKLERYLKHEKDKGTDKGQRTLLHLTSRLAMTESDILQAAFSSRHIKTRVGADSETKRADTLFLEYC
ncbi:MAG: hypothetical protein K0U34_00725 [Alphaproteobacteria bacterium]|nr:hypothetical protein [Alphaproteobacteria bacterium]